jgi:O-antigen biosynthesis protein WbqV
MNYNKNVRGIAVQFLRLVTDVVLSAVAVSTIILLPLTQTATLSDPIKFQLLLQYVGVYAVFATFSLIVSRAYRIIWRYVSFRDLLLLIQVATITAIAFGIYGSLSLYRDASISWPLMFITLGMIWFVNIIFLAAPRLLARALSEVHVFARRKRSSPAKDAVPALITGDVDRMEAFIRECKRSAVSRYRIVGALTEDGSLGGSNLQGIRVLGKTSRLHEIFDHILARGTRIETLILARNDATPSDYSNMLELAAPVGIKVGTLPPHGVFQDRTRVQPVELADLLGRPEVKLDDAAVASMIRGKSIVVTGAGGSIGSELTRQIARLKPGRLSVIDACEYNLYSIDRELAESYPEIPREAALADVRNGGLVRDIIERVHPDVLFHAAALKHVPLLEGQPMEAVKTNVIGTVNVAEACYAHNVPTVVIISTDKAVNPTNVMGASKRLAEGYCQGLDQSFNGGKRTRFVTVRFGNVLGSAGSVVPLFQRQIEAGGPVTVTHPEITRYFMTIPEAVTLVMQAGARGKGLDEERGSIYVLEMGQPVKILDLARQMIRLSGRRPDDDVRIEFVGLRPGEKLYEEVIHSDESVVPTTTNSILKVTPRVTDLRIVRQQVQEMIQACDNLDHLRIFRLLKLSVPEFVSAENDARTGSE